MKGIREIMMDNEKQEEEIKKPKYQPSFQFERDNDKIEEIYDDTQLYQSDYYNDAGFYSDEDKKRYKNPWEPTDEELARDEKERQEKLIEKEREITISFYITEETISEGLSKEGIFNQEEIDERALEIAKEKMYSFFKPEEKQKYNIEYEILDSLQGGINITLTLKQKNE